MDNITKQGALLWLDKQRSVVNDMIVGAAPEARRFFTKICVSSMRSPSALKI